MIPSAGPIETSPQLILLDAAPQFFGEPPFGHFWLEHLVRTIASFHERPASVERWRFFALRREEDDAIVAVYTVSTATRYAMFHAVDPKAAGLLLGWAVDHEPASKVLGTYASMEEAIRAAGLSGRIGRDHRELYLELAPGELQVEPDWDYRLATVKDIPRLLEYNALYNAERRTRWTRNWPLLVSRRGVYVRERSGVIASCLLKGALLPPRISFGGMFTFPEFRGEGEATMLVANYCAEMALSNLTVCLIVDDDNAAAIRAYTKAGFTPAGLYRTTYFDWDGSDGRFDENGPPPGTEGGFQPRREGR